jgi:hypothetical protein
MLYVCVCVCVYVCMRACVCVRVEAGELGALSESDFIGANLNEKGSDFIYLK